jgi:hypothetical protein
MLNAYTWKYPMLLINMYLSEVRLLIIPWPIGTKLRELMIKNKMDFGAVETELTRYKNSSLSKKKAGQWVTRVYLSTTMQWTKTGSQYFVKHISE